LSNCLKRKKNIEEIFNKKKHYSYLQQQSAASSSSVARAQSLVSTH
jgi:hypothetical protein